MATDPRPSKEQQTRRALGYVSAWSEELSASLRQRRLTKLDGEAVPHSELVELAIGHCDGNGLLVANVRRLGLQIPRRATAIVVIVSALDMAVRRGLVLGLGGVIILDALILVHIFVIVLALVVVVAVHGELVVEVVDVADVSLSATRVKLPRPERDPVVGVERLRRIFSKFGLQDGSTVAHLVMALSALAWHGRDRHACGVEVPASSR